MTLIPTRWRIGAVRQARIQEDTAIKGVVARATAPVSEVPPRVHAVMLAHDYFKPDKMLAAVVMFVAFCLTASSVYLTNDLLDLESDRQHRTKRNRPFASGAVPVAFGPPLAIGLLVGAFGLSWLALPSAATVTLLLFWRSPGLISSSRVGCWWTRSCGGL